VCFVVEGVANDLLGFGYGFLGYICFIGMLWLGSRAIGREWVQIDEKQWCLRWCCYSHCLCQFGECGVLKNMFIVSINVSAKLMMKFRVLRNDLPRICCFSSATCCAWISLLVIIID
jgi:hypothetical protein